MQKVEDKYVPGGWKTNHPRTVIGHSNGGFLALYISAKYPALFSEVVAMDPGIGQASVEYKKGSNDHVTAIVEDLVAKMKASNNQNPGLKRRIFAKSMGDLADDDAGSIRVRQGLQHMEQIGMADGLVQECKKGIINI